MPVHETPFIGAKKTALASSITDIAERHGVDVAQKFARHARLDQTGEYLVLEEERLRHASEERTCPPRR
jgi:hypothetical protein